MLDLEELSRLASAATPGPWTTLLLTCGADVRAPRPSGRSTWVAETRSNYDAAYIASCSPDRILKLVEIARAAQELEVHLSRFGAFPSGTVFPSLRALRAALEGVKK